MALRPFSADAAADQKAAILEELPKIFGFAMEPLVPMRVKMVDIVSEIKHAPATILDLASGPGEPAISLAKRFPDASVISADNNAQMVASAAEVTEGLSNV